MTEIRMGEVGYIEEGKKVGNYVAIQNDSERTGGILVFYSKLEDFGASRGGGIDVVFDHWVDDEEILKRYVAAMNWRIRWRGRKMFLDPGSNCPVDPE